MGELLTLKPIIALDCDGVIRPLREPKAGDIRVDCLFREDEYPDMFHRHPEWSKKGMSKGTIYFSRPAIEWVQFLLERGVEVQWATTWQRWANTYFGEALGFTLPVAVDSERTTLKGRAAEWKATQLEAAFPDRPIMWIDDNPPFTDRAGLFNREGFKFIYTDAATGLSDENIVEAEAWLKEHGQGV